MKRVSIAILAFVFFLCLGIVNSIYFKNVCDETISTVNESIRLAKEGEFDAAAEISQKAEDFWEGHRKVLSHTVNHGYIYEVDARLTGLSALSSEEAKEEFLSTAEQVVQAIIFIKSDK